MENYQIDNLDRGILDALMANARTAYAELAKQFSVSPGTIHVRVEKMKQAGIITGARIDVSPKQLGYDVGCFIGIILKSAKDYPSALARLESLEEIASGFEGVERSFAIQAGREVRIMVKPDAINDDALILLAHSISQKIEETLDYPGQIKVNVIRESRAVDYAK